VPGWAGRLVPIPTYRDAPSTPASDLAGTEPSGAAVGVAVLGVGHCTLLLFLSMSCDGCRELWAALGEGAVWAPEGGTVDVVPVVVTRGPGDEDPEALRRVAPPGVAVVQSSDAWRAYRVQGPPFFVLVDGPSGRVVTEGVAWGVSQVAAHVGVHVPAGAVPDAGAPPVGGSPGTGGG
jgi:hypothetical protein